MSNDDDNSRLGDSSPPRQTPRPRKTMLGLGFAIAMPEELAATDLELPRVDDDEFEDEATMLGATLGREVVDDAVHAAVDRAWESMFPDEIPMGAPDEFEAANDTDPGPTLAGEEVVVDSSWDEGLDTMSLDEESLPDPIRDPTPTLEDEDAPPPRLSEPDYVPFFVGDNTSTTDFEDVKTRLLDTPFENDPAVAKLVALDGPAAGQQFFATALRNSVGRGTDNAIVVPDLAMSRQHFEIVKSPDDSYQLVDLQSINGTTLNGTRVREADLFHGDRVEAGQSRFQFVVTGAPAAGSRPRKLVPAAMSTIDGKPVSVASSAPAAASHPVNRLLLAISIVAVVVSLVLFAIVAMLKFQHDAAPVASGADPTQVYLLGVEAVKVRDWERAVIEFERAQALQPSLQGIPEQLRRIEDERQAMGVLDDAQGHVDARNYDQALARLHDIPADSVYASQAADLEREARKAQVLRLYEQAQDAFSDSDTDRARELTANILARIPGHQGALNLQQRLAEESTDASLEPDPPQRSRRPASERKRDNWDFDLVGSRSSATPSRDRSPTQRVPDLTRGFLLYRSGKFEDAQKFFDDAASNPGPAAASTRRIADAVRDFRSRYKAGVAAFDAGNWADAERKLVAAKRADAVVGEYFDADLRRRLATIEANLGLQQLEKGDAVAARKLLDKGLTFNESDAGLAELQTALKREARSLYVKAQALKKSDPARAGALCRQIRAIVPPSDETHRKASALLASLGAR